MPSPLARIDSCLLQRLDMPFVADMSLSIIDNVDALHDHLTEDVNKHVDVGNIDMGYAFAMDQGLYVALCGLGQIVRQSKLSSPVDETSLFERLNNGVDILRVISRCSVDWAASIEERYRFIRPRFNNPRQLLTFAGSTVKIDSSLWSITLKNAEHNPKGCPFQKSLEKLYPHFVAQIAPLYNVIDPNVNIT